MRIGPDDAFETFVEAVGVERFRVLRDGGRLLAGAGSIAGAQSFGGRPVPSALVTVVWTAPEARGRGLASLVLRELHDELRAEGLTIASLHPANLGLYRSLGYEVAALNQLSSVSLAALEPRRPSGWSVEALPDVTPEAPGALAETYAAARPHLAPGHADRPRALWHSMLRWTEGGRSAAFLARSPSGEPRGHLVLDTIHSDATVNVRELVAQEPGASATLLAHLAGYRGIFDTARWRGGPSDAIAQALRDKPVATSLEPFMVRVLDPAAAMRARGWPPGLVGRWALEVEGAGPLTVALDGSGTAEVQPGGEATLAVSLRGLAALFTGFAAPRALAAGGQLSGADLAALDAVGAAFAGPAPWLVDRF